MPYPDLTAPTQIFSKALEVTIEPASIPAFSTELTEQLLTVGEQKEWTLPTIEEGSYPLAEVIVVPSGLISSLISFDKTLRKITFNGEAASDDIAGLFTTIEITLINSEGSENSYT